MNGYNNIAIGNETLYPKNEGIKNEGLENDLTEGIFVCIKNEGLENDLTLHKKYVGYSYNYNNLKYLHVYTDNNPQHPAGVEYNRFVTIEQWREQQLNKIL